MSAWTCEYCEPIIIDFQPSHGKNCLWWQNQRLEKQLADLMKAAAKVNTWIKAHPRKATIVQSVKDELDAALATALPPEELSK